MFTKVNAKLHWSQRLQTTITITSPGASTFLELRFGALQGPQKYTTPRFVSKFPPYERIFRTMYRTKGKKIYLEGGNRKTIRGVLSLLFNWGRLARRPKVDTAPCKAPLTGNIYIGAAGKYFNNLTDFKPTN